MNSISKDDVVRTYSFYAPIYDHFFGVIQSPGVVALCDGVARMQPKSILEIGVGTGLTLRRYPADAQITGIDLCPRMLSKARRRIETLKNRQIELHLMNAESTPFADASFDCVTIPYVLSVTPNPDALVREARRVCRPDGDIFILNHFSGAGFWRGLETVARPLASRIGFRSEFDFNEQILRHDWELVSRRTVAPMGLYTLVQLRNKRKA